jgi:hypothetical protein
VRGRAEFAAAVAEAVSAANGHGVSFRDGVLVGVALAQVIEDRFPGLSGPAPDLASLYEEASRRFFEDNDVRGLAESAAAVAEAAGAGQRRGVRFRDGILLGVALAEVLEEQQRAEADEAAVDADVAGWRVYPDIPLPPLRGRTTSLAEVKELMRAALIRHGQGWYERSAQYGVVRDDVLTIRMRSRGEWTAALVGLTAAGLAVHGDMPESLNLTVLGVVE